jgi:molecular chaperone Hsp33
VPPLPALVGSGHLALTIDPGATMRRYQGVVPLEGASLEEVAHTYFTQSEQIPTLIRLAVAETMVRGADGTPHRSWRGGAISVQFLPDSPGRIAHRDLDPGDAPSGTPSADIQDDDAWVEARARTGTVEDHELIDPEIDPARLLLRLFHQREVRVYDPIGIVEKCHCSRERVETMLKQFGEEDRRSMVEDGKVVVTCEFCNTRYTLDPAEIGVSG